MKFELFLKLLERELEQLKANELHRTLKIITFKNHIKATIDGRDVILFCTNDYLGLSCHRELKISAKRALKDWGMGGAASRLISGNLSIYEELESLLAEFKDTEASLVFSSGYATNLGLIPTIAQKEDIIFSDELNHASIVDACRLSKAKVIVFRHVDMEDLEDLLKKHRGKKKFIVTDGVFSMDGDLCPLPILLSLAQSYEATLIVDDAHATGVIGEKGKGSFEYWNLSSDTAIQVGTFSKAIGTQGGFVCGKKTLIEYLINKARPFVFSTALPPPVVAATKTAIKLIQGASNLRHKLFRLTTILRDGLNKLGFHIPTLPTPIVPLVVGDTQETINLSQHLFENGLFTPPIRPPTVPQGKSRLRISLSALHSEEDIEKLIFAIKKFFNRGT